MTKSEIDTSECRINNEKILFASMTAIMKNLQANMAHLSRPKYIKFSEDFIEMICDGVKNKRKFFLLASGRSAFILQCFATRLVHLGADVYMVTNLASNPALTENDLLIVLSGSGTTAVVVSLLQNIVNSVKPKGIACITSHPETIIGRIGDITIKLKGRTKRDHASDDDAILTPEGTAFEQVAFTYLDGIIAELAVRLNITDKEMLKRHSKEL